MFKNVKLPPQSLLEALENKSVSDASSPYLSKFVKRSRKGNLESRTFGDEDDSLSKVVYTQDS